MSGLKASETVCGGFTSLLDDQLMKGVTNSQALFDRLAESGYQGGPATVRKRMPTQSRWLIC